jgi:hypothetical protein
MDFKHSRSVGKPNNYASVGANVLGGSKWRDTDTPR